jgi:acyl carrier protein
LEKANLLTKVIDIIRKITSNPVLAVDETTKFDEIEEWDSLNTVDMEMELENIFSIDFEVGEFRELDDINALLTCITEKLK